MKTGDIVRLGRHRLMCGDATDPEHVAALLDGVRPDMVWTDPPYGVRRVGGDTNPLGRTYQSGRAIANDALREPELFALLEGAFRLADAACRDGAAWYVAAPAGPLHTTFLRVLNDLRIHRQTLIWVKERFVFGRSDYHYRHEPILYGWKPGAAHLRVADRTQDSVWEIRRHGVDMRHPSIKPLELVARAVRNSSHAGAMIYDPFAGSGTTLLAAEQEGRYALLMEIDPHYCDVIIERWQSATGETTVAA